MCVRLIWRATTEATIPVGSDSSLLSSPRLHLGRRPHQPPTDAPSVNFDDDSTDLDSTKSVFNPIGNLIPFRTPLGLSTTHPKQPDSSSELGIPLDRDSSESGSILIRINLNRDSTDSGSVWFRINPNRDSSIDLDSSESERSFDVSSETEKDPTLREPTPLHQQE